MDDGQTYYEIDKAYTTFINRQVITDSAARFVKRIHEYNDVMDWVRTLLEMPNEVKDMMTMHHRNVALSRIRAALPPLQRSTFNAVVQGRDPANIWTHISEALGEDPDQNDSTVGSQTAATVQTN